MLISKSLSYRRIYDTINPGGKPDNGNNTHQQLTSTFTQPSGQHQQSSVVNTSVNASSNVTSSTSSSGQSQQVNPDSSFPIPDVKRGKGTALSVGFSLTVHLAGTYIRLCSVSARAPAATRSNYVCMCVCVCSNSPYELICSLITLGCVVKIRIRVIS